MKKISKRLLERIVSAVLAIIIWIAMPVRIIYNIPVYAAEEEMQEKRVLGCGHNHKDYTLLTLQPIGENVLSTGKYYLDGDISIKGNLVIPENATVEICLNGYTLTFDGTDNYVDGGIGENDIVTIENGGIVYQSVPSAAAFKVKDGELKMNNCDVSILSDMSQNGTAIWCAGNGIVDIISSTISGSLCWVVYMNDGYLFVTDSVLNGGKDKTVYMKCGDASLVNTRVFDVSGLNLYGIYMGRAAKSLELKTCDVEGSYGVYLEGREAKITDCDIKGGIINSGSYISLLMNTKVTSDSISLQNGEGSFIDKIEDCTFVSEGTAIYNMAEITSIDGGMFTSKDFMSVSAALRNEGIISDISGNAKFYGVNAVKNEDKGTISISDATAVGMLDPQWESVVGFKVYMYAVNPSPDGMVIINGGNFGCGTYKASSEEDKKLFPDGASGIEVRGGNFQLQVPQSVLASGKVNTDSGILLYPYTVGEPNYTITYDLDGGENHVDNPEFYQLTVGVRKLNVASKSGYRFVGWQDGTGVFVTSIPAGTTGDITLTAIWEKETVYYTVKLENIDGFTADRKTETTVQQGHSYTVVLSAVSGYVSYPYSEFFVGDSRGQSVPHTLHYNLDTQTATITITDIQCNVVIIYRASICKHNYVETILKPATHTEEGSKKLECSICHNVIMPVRVPVIKHAFAYQAQGDQIIESCECGYQESAKLVVSDNLATVEYSENWQGGTLEVLYTKNGEPVPMPVGAGEYTAFIRLYGVTASVSWIEKETGTTPEEPTEPEKPTEPSKPVDPERPTEPVNPPDNVPDTDLDSTSEESEQQEETIEIPTEHVSGTTVVQAKGVSGKDWDMVPITKEHIKEVIQSAKIEAAKRGAKVGSIVVTIQISTENKIGNQILISIPEEVQKQIISYPISQITFSVDKLGVSVGFDKAAVTEILSQAEGEVELVVTLIDKEMLSKELSEEGKAAVGDRPVFDIKIICQDGSKEISKLSKGMVSIEIPYIKQETEAAGGLQAVYIEGNYVDYITDSVYNKYTKELLLRTNHFSVYGVGYKQPEFYADIQNHWAKNEIEFAVSRNLWTVEDMFNPENGITYGEFIYALEGLTKTTLDYQLLCGGNSLEKFVTREGMAVMILNYAEITGVTLVATRMEPDFLDISWVSSDTKKAIQRLQEAGIVNGKDGTQFDPAGIVTRAEACNLLCHYIERAINPDTAQGWTKNASGHWFYYKEGKKLVGWQVIDGLHYYFNIDGVMHENWKQNQETKDWYYWTNESTAVGFKEIDGVRYYFKEDGALQITGQ